ncbi:MAG: hypothetical protein ACRDDX_06995 [Cellulosilyticaceae bacterium]
MMESKWMQERQADAAKARKQAKNKRNTILIGSTIAVIVALIAMVITLEDYQLQGGLICILPVYLFLVLVSVVGLRNQIKEMPLAVEADLVPYLTSDKAVEDFEKEMYGKPKAEIKVGGGINECTIKITNNWFTAQLKQFGKPYRVFKLEEVGYVHGARIDQSQFVIDVCRTDEKVLFSFHPTGKKEYFKLLQFLLDELPDVDWKAYTKGMPSKAS